ncbi:hypothetical protein SAY87_016954 [Trapa incisa]|uniref:CASP-like protein n=1 Tax=Trapa incisa TaxID=236973 RepID=A0AAN7LDA1_9MYRT|nr:hypothetical protein SAY87_016954 [Trapa incisa]
MPFPPFSLHIHQLHSNHQLILRRASDPSTQPDCQEKAQVIDNKMAKKQDNKVNPETVEEGQPPAADAPDHKANRSISIADLVMRAFAAIGTLGSAVIMATTNQATQFSQIFQFRAEYSDLPTFMFFVVTNSIVCAYLVLSLALSIFHVIRSKAVITRIILVVFDTVMLALLMAAASAAAAIVYLAHKGNTQANWFAICQQYDSFCGRMSGSLVGSYVATIALVMLIILSTIAISKSK